MKRCELNKDLAFQYLREAIEFDNELSRHALNLIDFENKGSFFTFLPDDVAIQVIHKFSCGGIAEDSKKGIILFLLKKLLSGVNYHLIFDDVFRNYKDLLGKEIFDKYGLHYHNEAYYLLNSADRPSLDWVEKCLRHSDTIWHCLGILFSGNLSELQDKTLTLPIITEMCQNADLIVTTAYDGEGCIFWERTK